MSNNDLVTLLIIIVCALGLLAIVAIFAGIAVRDRFDIGRTIKNVLFRIFPPQDQSSSTSHALDRPPLRPHRPTRLPAFRVININRPYVPGSLPNRSHAPRAWGSLVNRPSSVKVFHNQENCGVCRESIHFTFKSKGWARCPVTKKLVHGYCHDAWLDSKGGGCPVCESGEHNMKKIPYATR